MAAVSFHPLTVSDIEHITEDAIRVTFEPPPDERELFEHLPGQHLTLRATIDGDDVRRSYSICSPQGNDALQVGIKLLPGGVFSTWAHEGLAVGDVIASTPPSGDFTLDSTTGSEGPYVAIAAGSGITPVLSIIASTLHNDPTSRFTLVYGNRTSGSVMFLDDIDALKGAYPDRFMVLHILSREQHDLPVLSGRIDADKVSELCERFIPVSAVRGWYLCGPKGMVEASREALGAMDVDAAIVYDELFFAGGEGPIAVAEDDVDGSEVRFTLDGRTSSVFVDPDGTPILDHVLRVRPEGPFSCRSGACASCRALVTKGEVRMDRNWSLNQEEVDAGQVLTCQAHPVSDTVELTYDT
ncbi:MAG: 2Fe-2S iron-sulfur cluster-binding protein [Acidimicrobiia bacterium]